MPCHFRKGVPYQKYRAILQNWANRPSQAGCHKWAAKQEVCQLKKAFHLKMLADFKKFATLPFNKLPSVSTDKFVFVFKASLL